MRNERGFTLVEIIIVMSILALSSTLIVPRVVASQKQSQELSIESDRATLKTKCSVYYLNTSEHAIKTAKLTSLMDKDTDNFVNWLSTKLGLTPNTAKTYDEIDKRFGWVSCQKLIDENLLDSFPSDDRYVLDTQTYTIYHVSDAEEVWDGLFVESGSYTNSLDNMTVRRFPIKHNTVYMSKVNSTCLTGNVIYAGGKGTMTLAKIEISATTQTVTDISNKLSNAVEVYGVSSVGSKLRVEYLNRSNKVVIDEIDF